MVFVPNLETIQGIRLVRSANGDEWRRSAAHIQILRNANGGEWRRTGFGLGTTFLSKGTQGNFFGISLFKEQEFVHPEFCLVCCSDVLFR